MDAQPARSGDVSRATRWRPFEATVRSDTSYDNPFTDVEVDGILEHDAREWVVPAFWRGGDTWTVRFAPPLSGEWQLSFRCTDGANRGLNGHSRSVCVADYRDGNPLLRHGFVGVSENGRYFAHADGTPFFWLADTWWKGLAKRLSYDGFCELAADRREKGFTVVQIVCGPYPDEPAFQRSWGNEGGLPYESRDLGVINPVYFDYAERRLTHLVDTGIIPAIVGGWGRSDCNCMETAGVAGLKRHWRYLVARFGALPVVWFVGGEIPEDAKRGAGEWGEVASYLRTVDPYRHPITCHSCNGRRADDAGRLVIDFDMVGGEHDGHLAIQPKTLARLTSSYPNEPIMPMFCGETAYEGHMQRNFQYIQRHVFWMYVLNGAAGHTYGAAGVWHAATEDDPGISPVYDWTTWREGAAFPGAAQIGLGMRFLDRFAWHRMEPHPEWTGSGCHAAGVPAEFRLIYQPRGELYDWRGPEVMKLESGLEYDAYYFDPASGRLFDAGVVTHAGEPDSIVDAPSVPSPQDWLLVLDRTGTLAGEPCTRYRAVTPET